MGSRAESNISLPHVAGSAMARAVARAAVWILVALVAYAVWRGYQNPDLLLDFSALRLC